MLFYLSFFGDNGDPPFFPPARHFFLVSDFGGLMRLTGGPQIFVFSFLSSFSFFSPFSAPTRGPEKRAVFYPPFRIFPFPLLLVKSG